MIDRPVNPTKSSDLDSAGISSAPYYVLGGRDVELGCDFILQFHVSVSVHGVASWTKHAYPLFTELLLFQELNVHRSACSLPSRRIAGLDD